MRIIFLTYQNRSGSTFLSNLFSRDSRVCVCLEAEVLIHRYLFSPSDAFRFDDNERNRIDFQISNNIKLKHWNLDRASLFAMLENARTNFDAFSCFLFAYQQKYFPDADTILFKGTRLSDVYQNVHPLYNKKGITFQCIRIVRDPRAIFYSQQRTVSPTTLRIMNNNPLEVARAWHEWIDQTNQFAQSSFFTIKYEDLIVKGDSVFIALCESMGIKFRIDFPKGNLMARLPEKQREIHQNLENGFLLAKITEWEDKLPRITVSLIEWRYKEQMRLFGYTPKQYRISFLSFAVTASFHSLRSKIKLLKKFARGLIGRG